MAYSCVKVLFEIGHEASIRAKQTPEGFTHDWEVFVRGGDNSEIYHFVEKVVFHLHETFPKPKRVVKEPPYSVKESGYAGFNLPIDIYFKNSDEPKKVRYNYDLHLQPSGPPISKVLKEQYVFPNPAEDLRRRLIKGGGVGVLGSESNFHLASCDKLPTVAVDDSISHKHTTTPALVGKPKLSSSGDSNKKHKKEGKIDEPRTSNSFHDLFGPPIKTKVSPDPKKSSHSPKVSPLSKPQKLPEKSGSADKADKSSKSSKHGSQREGKDSERSSSSTKEERKDKEKNRDKEKSKEKPPKRPPTPVKSSSPPPKRSSSPLSKRPPSPSPLKLLAPPAATKLPTSPKHLPLAKSNKDESKKSSSEEIKSRNESKSGESGRSEKKKKDKKNRDEKPKKDKHKEHDKGSEKASKGEKCKESKERDGSKRVDKEAMKEPEKSREKEKSKYGDGEKEKQRHKHKKKDKSNKEKDREKSSKKCNESKLEIRDKEKNGLANDSSRGSVDTSSDISVSHKRQAASSPLPSPVRPATTSPKKLSPTPEKSVSSTLVKEKIVKRPIALLSDDSSDSNSSVLSADEDLDQPINRIKLKNSDNGLTSGENKSSTLPVAEPPRPNSRNEIIKPKSETSNQERNSLSKHSSKQKEKAMKRSKGRDAGGGGDVEKEGKKRKRKSGSRTGDESESLRNNGETPSKILKVENEVSAAEPVQERAAAEGDNEMKEESELEETRSPTTHLTEEYVSELRELQHKIMALEDNSELQRVVQVIAETGQYEITKKTFDFDLCALDKSTVKRLQAFFVPS